MKLNYFLVPLATILVVWAGRIFSAGSDSWYQNLKKPKWTPAPAFIATIWTEIFILTCLSALMSINAPQTMTHLKTVIGLYVANAVLNILWSYIFFDRRKLGWAVVEAVVLAASVVALIVVLWSTMRFAAIVLLPYLVWVVFATYLAYNIW